MSLADALLLVLSALALVAESLVFGTLAVRLLAYRPIGVGFLRFLFLALLLLLPAALAAQSAVMVDSHNLSATLAGMALVMRSSWVGHLTLLRAAGWLLTWLALRRGKSPHWALLPAGVALALHAGAGHAVATGDVWLFAAVLAHVLAGAAWIGGLPALWMALDSSAPAAKRLVGRYTWYGLACVLIVAGSAVLQSLQLAGGVLGLIGTDYGHVLLIKIALLGMLLLLALRHRFVLTPRLPASLSALRRSVLLETAIGVAVLCAASLLAALPPGAHEQPTWPFPWRISFDLLDDEELRAEVVNAAPAMGGVGLLALLAIIARRVRWLAVAVGIGITWFAIPHFDLMFAPTVPTYYWQSGTDFTPASIKAGQAAFVQNCASCHGARAEVDGPLAKTLAVPPPDLTAPHLWEHYDGELYWRIAHGITGVDGRVQMPGFNATLDDETIWSLIDFLHANNPNKPDGVLLGGRHHHN